MFRRLAAISCLVLSSLLAGPALAILQPGEQAPDFTVQAARAGEVVEFSLAKALAKGPVVLFFYPKAFTAGCTVQVHLFSRALPEFAALNASVIGMSSDPIDVQQAFSKKECGKQLEVGADPEGNVIRAYDASLMIGSGTSKRVTYVIAPDGRIIHTYADMNPKEHVPKALNAIKRWGAGQAAPAASANPQ